MILVAVVLAIVAFFAFAFAIVPRDSEVAMHLFSDAEFARARITYMTVGVIASVLEVFVLSRLLRRRSS